MNEPQPDVTEVAQAEGPVRFLDGEIDKLVFDVGVVARCLLRVGDNHINDDVIRFRGRLIL